MKTYRAFGLTLESEFPLPELCETRDAPDAEIRSGSVEPRSDALSPDGREIRVRQVASGTYLDGGVGRVLVTEGTTIVVDVAPGATGKAFRQFLLGPVLRLLLHQRGALVLHASAVRIGGRAVAFTGPSGAGKSTAAGACYANGHGLVADDIVPVRHDGGDAVVPPGFPRAKLAPATARELELPRVPNSPPNGRVYYRIERRFPSKPLPLSRIYVIAEGSEPQVADVSPGEAVFSIARNTYSTRDEDAEHFERCATLAKRVDVRRLSRPPALDRLDELVEVIEHDGRQAE
ncbi:hypothetical protein CV102_10305 [Natronococcus pandeyae]|uniref:Serine/threonine protein kinase n=1 Tax=Natronococcus pandeyae TaxID=2055836 RepID=A0A8J8TSC6_9EURY|nr:hypothetical protein [Natronococcus pandeyae]TYL38890.1 hypothetical protein CV102_10305 [Natronococcus pandeyae]